MYVDVQAELNIYSLHSAEGLFSCDTSKLFPFGKTTEKHVAVLSYLSMTRDIFFSDIFMRACLMCFQSFRVHHFRSCNKSQVHNCNKYSLRIEKKLNTPNMLLSENA